MTIDLTVNPVAATPITQTICAGDSIIVNGTTYNATGIYTDTLVAANGCDIISCTTDTLVAANGCDSVLTINLTVNPVASTPITQTICAGDSIIVNGTTYNATIIVIESPAQIVCVIMVQRIMQPASTLIPW